MCGVMGSGKSTIAEEIAKKLNGNFLDADSFHSAQNKEKMKNGIPLNDDDRRPWLESMNNELKKLQSENKTKVITLACSALKTKYRQLLGKDLARAEFFALKLDKQVLIDRLKQRTGHFMNIDLLDSQLATWEDPDSNTEKNVNVVNANEDVNGVLSQIMTVLNGKRLL